VVDATLRKGLWSHRPSETSRCSLRLPPLGHQREAARRRWAQLWASVLAGERAHDRGRRRSSLRCARFLSPPPLVCIDREMRKWRLGFGGRTGSGVYDPPKVTHIRRIRIDGRCSFWLETAQVGDEFHGPSLCRVLLSRRGLDRAGCFEFLGQIPIRIFG
jgi:hypothetical protein